MTLDENQKQAVARWIAEGCGISQIQQRLGTEFGLNMTYMDVRFLLIDTGLQVKDKPQPKARAQDVSAVAPEADAPRRKDAGRDWEKRAGRSAVSVDLDRVTKAGTVFSGTVTFSDGVSASWALDQFGRLALDAGQPGYRPSARDLDAFQTELRRHLEKRGL